MYRITRPYRKQRDCRTCSFYQAYYRIGIFNFWKEKSGFCTRKNTEVDHDETCGSLTPCERRPATLNDLVLAEENARAILSFLTEQKHK